MDLRFRPATANDAIIATSLLYLADPSLFDFIYGTNSVLALNFINFAFQKGGGFAGHRIHYIAEKGGVIVGLAADYRADNYHQLCDEDEMLIREFYNADECEDVLERAGHVESIMAPPIEGMYYFANFAVSPKHHRQGIGRAIMDYAFEQAKQRKNHIFALDVGGENKAAIHLYEKCGLAIESKNAFSVPDAGIPDGYRMVLNLT